VGGEEEEVGGYEEEAKKKRIRGKATCNNKNNLKK
jgi:hypothetical protein